MPGNLAKISKSCCDCCGTCCRNGGPALHVEDRHLLDSGLLRIEDLVTVRQGEHVYPPLSDTPQPSLHEFLKIRGKGENWCCIFYDEEQSLCTFYKHRPVACRILKCWEPEEILAIAGKNLLDRSAVISVEEPIYSLFEEHEKKCSLATVNTLVAQWSKSPQTSREILVKLSILVNTDITYREFAIRKFRLSLEKELFYFGRPLFQIIIPFGFRIIETPEGLVVQR